MSDLSSFGKQYQQVRVAILGASGFIGRWVARMLCIHGVEPYLIVRDKARANRIFSRYEIEGELIELDLIDFPAVEAALRELRPAITFNLAGYGVDKTEKDEKTAYQINGLLVQAICEGIAGIRESAWHEQTIVHAGSALEYGEIGGNLAEDSAPVPTTLYGKSKLAGTNYLQIGCRLHGIRGLTARLFTVYGPGEHPGRLLPVLLKTAKRKTSLPLTVGNQVRDFTYVADIAEGLLRLGLTQTEPGEIVNLATGKLSSVRGFVETAAEVLRIPSELLEFGAIPTHTWEMEHNPVSIERLKCLTGWSPSTGISEGIRRTLEFDDSQIEGVN